jgi:histidinol-phosphate aminotransferase
MLKQRGILVRYFKQPRLADKLRITVGTPEQNETLIKVLGEVITSVMPKDLGVIRY